MRPVNARSVPRTSESTAPSLDSALRYANERKAFGEPIANFQLIQQMLADSEIEIYAAEIEAYMRWKAREEDRAAPVHAPAPAPSRTKEKIVRALRKKS